MCIETPYLLLEGVLDKGSRLCTKENDPPFQCLVPRFIALLAFLFTGLIWARHRQAVIGSALRAHAMLRCFESASSRRRSG
jgi:hypothetical protein